MNENNKKKIISALVSTKLTGRILCVFKLLYNTGYRWVPYSELKEVAGVGRWVDYNVPVSQVIGKCGLWANELNRANTKLPQSIFLEVREKVRSHKYFQLTPEFRECIGSSEKLLNILSVPDEQLRKDYDPSKYLELGEEDFSLLTGIANSKIPKNFVTAVEKRAVELRAMEVVAAYYLEKGWQVEDTSKSNPEGHGTPYDFRITKDDKKKYVEVKGLSNSRDQVTLTGNEVCHAVTHSLQSVLVVVGDIRVSEKDGYFIGEEGKIIYHEDPWFPEEARLTPTQYRYDIRG